MTTTEKQIREARRWAGTIASGYGSKLVAGLADALERQQAVVEAMRTIKEREGKVCDEYETCTHAACQSSYNAWAIADEALAALDAPLEGEKSKSKYRLGDALHRDWPAGKW